MKHRCIDCGGKMTTRKQTRRYGREISVVLKGIEVRHCGECGEEQVVIPRILELHEAIAKDIANHAAALGPGEIRFLRTHMGFSSKDFARVMGVKPETVSRWENIRNPMNIRPTADRLIRFLIRAGVKFNDYGIAEAPEDCARESDPPKFSLSESGWVSAGLH